MADPTKPAQPTPPPASRAGDQRTDTGKTIQTANTKPQPEGSTVGPGEGGKMYDQKTRNPGGPHTGGSGPGTMGTGPGTRTGTLTERGNTGDRTVDAPTVQEGAGGATSDGDEKKPLDPRDPTRGGTTAPPG